MELKKRVSKYLKKAENKFENLELNTSSKEAKKFLEKSKNYYQDAIYYFKKGKYVESLACLEYAEGWLDAGLEINYLKIKK